MSGKETLFDSVRRERAAHLVTREKEADVSRIDELKIDQGYGICPVHGYAWRKGRNMANAPDGLHCPWDGSMHPDEFMAYLEKPGTRLTPTDKNYKVYIDVESGEPEQMRRVSSTTRKTRPGDENGMEYGRQWMTWEEAVELHPELREEYEQHLRHVASLAPSHRWHTETTWIQVDTRGDRRESKFYFEHLSDVQKQRFVELLNEGKLNLREPGYFYARPFFIARESR